MQQPFPDIPRRAQIIIGGIPEDGCSVLNYLAGRFNYLDAAGWTAQINAGNLLVNNMAAQANDLLHNGDSLEFITRGLQEPEVPWNIKIVADQANFIVLNKPAGLPCHPAGKYFNHTLWAWLRQCAKIENPHFVGRLDRETSGLIIIAKDSKTAAKMAKADAIKEYEVKVFGKFPDGITEADGWIGPDTASCIHKKRKFSRQRFADAEYCHTTLELISSTDDTSTLRAILHTGRTHQIRATMLSLGYPVIGDKLYGPDENMFLKQANGKLTPEDYKILRQPHQALCCVRITADYGDFRLN